MLRFRLLSLLRRPSSGGIPPWRLLFDSCSLARELRLAMQGGMVPVMPCDARSSAITRRGDPVLQVTPCSLQNPMDMLLQDNKTPAGSVSWDLKQRSACRSFSFSSETASSGQQKSMNMMAQRSQETPPGDMAPKEAIALSTARRSPTLGACKTR
jgi:hypothetical protein